MSKGRFLASFGHWVGEREPDFRRDSDFIRVCASGIVRIDTFLNARRTNSLI